jgi:hypothetical protein
MTPTKDDSFDKNSQHFEKWLIKIKYSEFKQPIYLVWLTDTLDNETDKMLINSSGQIIGSKNPSVLFDFIQRTRHKLFDSRKTKGWARMVYDLPPKPTVTYNLDKFIGTTKNLDQKNLEELANFINLFGDLITTTKDKGLNKLKNKKEINEVWEYYYNNVFWPKFNDPKQFKKIKVKPYKINPLLERTLNKMTLEFVQRIDILE